MLLYIFIVVALCVGGLMLRSALLGGDNEKIAFVVNLMAVWLIAAILFGYPAIIVPALVMVPVVLVILFLLTTGNTMPAPAPTQTKEAGVAQKAPS